MILDTFFQLATNSAIISLIAGILAGIYTRLALPSNMMNIISMYLIFAIGFKGGACIGVANACTGPLMMLAAAGMILGFLQPFFNHTLLHKITNLDEQTLIVLAAQYGSISIVTFITAISFLSQNEIPYDTFMSAIAGMMEIPAIFSGLLLLNFEKQSEGKAIGETLKKICKAIVFCKNINVIFLGFFVGMIFNNGHIDIVEKAILAPFSAMLVLFMVDMGLKIADQRKYFTHFSLSLFAFGTIIPIIFGAVGVLISSALGNFVGTSVLFASLISSASYIAVPAIMQSEAPHAKEAIYMPMALGVTLPFNLLIGIPAYYFFSSYLAS